MPGPRSREGGGEGEHQAQVEGRRQHVIQAGDNFHRSEPTRLVDAWLILPCPSDKTEVGLWIYYLFNARLPVTY